MRLKSVTVGNFRNVAETTIELNRLVAIVSTNNYGKSNLLDAIRYGFGFISSSPKERNRMMRSRRNLPLNPVLCGKSYRFIVEFEDDTMGDEYKFVRYGFSFSWGKDEGGACIDDEVLDIKKTPTGKYTQFLKRGESSFRPNGETKYFKKIRLAKDVLAIDILSGIEDIDISKVISAVKNLNCKICAFLDLNTAFMFNPVELTNPSPDMIPFDDFGVPRSLNILREQYPYKYESFLDVIYELFPEFDKIELKKFVIEKKDQSVRDGETATEMVNPSDNIPFHMKEEVYQLAVESAYVNQSVDVNMMSMGTKRIIWLIANAMFGECYGYNLMGVEEIETSIHPRLIKTLLESLAGCLDNSTMILTSHSPFIIQYLNLAHIYVGLPGRDGVATFRKPKKSKEKLIQKYANEHGTSAAEYLFDLMSGDERSARILASYFEE
ncbi:MAG: AAA family ATPase [Clostridia bacterium]|nr:AAA family ATPase [Clostridia bacterium]